MSGEIAGYTYGTEEAARSPVALEELAELRRAALFTEEDEERLRRIWETVADRAEEVFQTWVGHVGFYFAPTFAGPNGAPDEAYLAAAHGRFIRWIEDTCTRPYDRAWLDYQHEIGLRHHRAKKNVTDSVDSVDVVPFRWLPVTVAPLTFLLRPFLAERWDDADTEAMLASWTKTLLLQVALWSRAYVAHEDW